MYSELQIIISKLLEYTPSINWEPLVFKEQKDIIASKYFWGEEIHSLPRNKVKLKKREVNLLKEDLLAEWRV